MPNVLILGGAGYVGLAVGQALLRTGNYSVFATTRDAGKSKMLLSNEITPLVGQVNDEAFVLEAIRAHRIDTVVDLTQAYQDATAVLQTVIKAAKARAAAALATAADGSSSSFVGPKLGFVYTSGLWVHGSPGKTLISDTTVPGSSLAPSKPATAVSWRPAHEQAVLAAGRGGDSAALDVAILRPGNVYGRGSWIWGTYFGSAAAKAGTSDAIELPADKETMVGNVHVDDVADGFVLAIDGLAGGWLGGSSWPVFDFITETLPIAAVMQPVADILGAKGPIVYTGTQGNPFFEAMALVSNSSSARARAVLGWSPKHRTMLQDLPVLVAAWKAGQE